VDFFVREDLNALLAEHRSPCVSFFLPTHRGGSEEDPIRWRKHLAEADERLARAGLRAAEVRELLTPAQRLLDETEFWKHQSDGVAAFLAPQFFRLYRLPLAFKELVVVANRFSIAPLLPLLSGNGRFLVLALSQHAIRLLQGTRYSVSEVDLQDVPQSLAEALLTHEAKQPFSFVGRRAGKGAGSWGGIFHGHGVGIDDPKDELLHYFQKIDRGLHPLLRDEKSPLVLAAVDYLQAIYRRASTYAQLLDQGVAGNPDRLSNRELHDRAWPLVRPVFEREQERADAEYRQLAVTQHASGNLEAVVAAAYQGRVESLFVGLGHQIWGVYDPTTGRVGKHQEASVGDVDLLELAVAHTLAHGGTVYPVEPERVPSNTMMAAIFSRSPAKHGIRL